MLIKPPEDKDQYPITLLGQITTDTHPNASPTQQMSSKGMKKV